MLPLCFDLQLICAIAGFLQREFSARCYAAGLVVWGRFNICVEYEFKPLRLPSMQDAIELNCTFEFPRWTLNIKGNF